MSYKVTLNEQAAADLRRLPEPVQRFVVKSLLRLELNPEAESRPTTGLHPKGWLFELEYALSGLDFFIDVLFRFGPVEDELTVFSILWEYV